jgi:hypothetical protein
MLPLAVPLGRPPDSPLETCDIAICAAHSCDGTRFRQLLASVLSRNAEESELLGGKAFACESACRGTGSTKCYHRRGTSDCNRVPVRATKPIGQCAAPSDQVVAGLKHQILGVVIECEGLAGEHVSTCAPACKAYAKQPSFIGTQRRLAVMYAIARSRVSNHRYAASEKYSQATKVHV